MKFVYVICAFLLLGFGASAQEILDCDLLAAGVDDKSRPQVIGGVPDRELEAQGALDACLLAIQRYPTVARYQYQLGRAYLAADDKATAVHWFGQAASAGHPEAMLELYDIFRFGGGGPNNDYLALHYLQGAAYGGNLSALRTLKAYYDGVTSTSELAIPLATKAENYQYVADMAARLGDASSALELAKDHNDNTGPRNASTAAWYLYLFVRHGGAWEGPSTYFAGIEFPPERLDTWPNDVIRELQVLLQDHGFFDGAADGVLGPKTIAALRRTATYDREISSAVTTSLPSMGGMEKWEEVREVLACAKPGTTVRQMHDCSGRWVTPQALLLCSLGTQCPVVEDTIAGWQRFEAALAAEGMTLDTVLELRPEDLPLPEATAMAACAEQDKATLIACVLDATASQDSELLECAKVSAVTLDGARCLALLAQDDEVAAILECAKDGVTFNALVSCGVLDDMPDEDIAKLVACQQQATDEADLVFCMSDEDELRNAYRCTAAADSISHAALTCGAELLDEDTRRTVNCMVEAESYAGIAGCAAAPHLSPDAARLATCAATTSGYASFALCAIDPDMNAEWRIAAECAVESSGNPYYFAGCTATKLTVRELTKCINGTFGRDCFGENNTFVAYFRNGFSDLFYGPGGGNDLAKAISAVGVDVEAIRPLVRTPADAKRCLEDLGGCAEEHSPLDPLGLF